MSGISILFNFGLAFIVCKNDLDLIGGAKRVRRTYVKLATRTRHDSGLIYSARTLTGLEVKLKRLPGLFQLLINADKHWFLPYLSSNSVL